MSSPSYIHARDMELFLRYYEAIKKDDSITNQKAIEIAIKSPTSKFWVSPFQVYREILNIVNGRKQPPAMRSIRKRMINDIYERYKELESKPTFRGCSTFFLVQFAVELPAPEFYLSYNRALAIIARIKREYIIENEE